MYFICLLMCLFSPIQAQQQDSIRFSLLTCTPGPVIYELFGHTAIRYQNFSKSSDLVFNYGLFDFDTPNFEYRFAKGETDYQLGINYFESFKRSYARRGSSVYEQELNLTYSEKLKLQQLLFENYKPENRVYRYNYFYKNCTTCARDQIERSIDGLVIYPEGRSDVSFRKIVHEFTAGSPWDELGMDFCLGAEADENIDIRLQMFSPIYMRDFAAKAVIKDSEGMTRPLVLKETKLVDSPQIPHEPGFVFSPMVCALIFLLANLCIAYMQIKRKRIYWGWDLFLYGIQGIAGCIIAFLFFFSSHPTVGSNWMLALLHPIALFYLPWMVYRHQKHVLDYFSVVNVVYLTLFMISIPFIPQEFNLTILPLAFGLLANAASHVIVTKK